MREFILELDDGRQLSYGEYGDPSGTPVIHMHGRFSSRYEGRLAGSDLEGMRLICPERPGYGRSDPDPSYSVSDWVSDVEKLANHLGFDDFAISGLSMGAVYALACAVDLPDRVKTVAIVSGQRPLNSELAWQNISDQEKAVMEGDEEALAQEREIAANIHASAEMVVEQQRGRDPADLDADVLTPSAKEKITTMLREGTHTAEGSIGDLQAGGSPWTFDLSTISQPVRWWHGDQDQACPLGEVRECARDIPSGQLQVVEGGGHFSTAVVALPRAVRWMSRTIDSE